MTKSDLEIADEVFDRLRGGPKRKMRELANELELGYEELLEKLRAYINDEDDFIGLGVDTPYETVPDMWAWYELITGEVVPRHKRDNPFSCSC